MPVLHHASHGGDSTDVAIVSGGRVQSFANASAPYRRGEARVGLMPEGRIPKGALILTGTAAGVIFRPVNVWNPTFYLAPGDLVRTRADFLGELANRVER